MVAPVKCRPVGTSASPIEVCRQPPVVGLQESMVQASPSAQFTGTEVQVGAPVNGSDWQVPPGVHGLPSSHAPPSIGAEAQVPPMHESSVQGLASSHTSGVLTHAPVAGSHASAVQGSPSAHFGVPWQIGLGFPETKTQAS